MFATLLMLAGIAGVAGRLPRNRFLGVRSPETLLDDDSFALANRVAGPTMIAASVIVLSGAAAAALLGWWLGAVVAAVTVVSAILVAGMGASMGIQAAASRPAADACSSCSGCSLAQACQPDTEH
uniref:SdpI family protein n=1 Tax=Lolliginicoccus suaedae TaxID=2605429 RepID=UPI0038B38765